MECRETEIEKDAETDIETQRKRYREAETSGQRREIGTKGETRMNDRID